MVRGLLVAALASLALAAATTAATGLPGSGGPPSPTLVITGHGWGHGVGMSQWGAYGYALHGWDAARILGHYYPGTTLGTAKPAVALVLLAEDEATVTLASAAPWRIVDGAGTVVRRPAGSLELPATLRVGRLRLVSPLTVKPGTAPLAVGGSPYRGSLVVSSDGSTLQVVNAVRLDDYVDGVVGEEISPSWPEAALEAQAIAARSFALAEIANTPANSTFDLYADGRSQVYGGIDAESPAVSHVVAATARKVVLYDGTVALAYFGSSSGGRTADAADVVGVQIPYLVSVPDPWDTYSPYHDWGPITFSARAAGKALGLHGALLDLELQSAPDGRVVSATATTAKGQVTLTGAEVRDDLNLRSSWFQISLQGGTTPAGAAPEATDPAASPAVQADGMPVPRA